MQNEVNEPSQKILLLSIEESIQAINANNIGRLREIISNLNELAFLQESSLLVNFSSIFYSISKFIEKDHIRNSPKWQSYKQSLIEKLNKSQACLKSNPINLEVLDSISIELISDCDEISELLGRFHISTVEKAKVKIAADFYARGSSLGVASNLTGADKSDVLTYIGATRIVDKYMTISINSRLKSAEEFFN